MGHNETTAPGLPREGARAALQPRSPRQFRTRTISPKTPPHPPLRAGWKRRFRLGLSTPRTGSFWFVPGLLGAVVSLCPLNLPFRVALLMCVIVPRRFRRVSRKSPWWRSPQYPKKSP